MDATGIGLGSAFAGGAMGGWAVGGAWAGAAGAWAGVGFGAAAGGLLAWAAIGGGVVGFYLGASTVYSGAYAAGLAKGLLINQSELQTKAKILEKKINLETNNMIAKFISGASKIQTFNELITYGQQKLQEYDAKVKLICKDHPEQVKMAVESYVSLVKFKIIADIEKLNTQFLLNKIVVLESTLANNNGTIQILQDTNRGKDERMRVLEDENARLRAEINALKEEKKTFETRLNTLRVELRSEYDSKLMEERKRMEDHMNEKMNNHMNEIKNMIAGLTTSQSQKSSLNVSSIIVKGESFCSSIALREDFGDDLFEENKNPENHITDE